MSQSKDITVKFSTSKPSQSASRGRMMDFAPRRRPMATDTVGVSRRQPTARVIHPAPASRAQDPVSSQASSAPVLPVPKRQSFRRSKTPSPRTQSKPQPKPTPQTAPLARRQSTPPTASPSVQASPPPITPLEAYNDLDNYTDFDDLTLGIIEDLDEPLDQRLLEQPPESTPVQPKKTSFFPSKTLKNKTSKAKTPKNSPHHSPKSSTGTTSPFINTAQLEKRPLSAFRSDARPSTPAKNIYASRLQAAAKEKDTPTLVTTKASKKSSVGLIITVVIVLILAVIVGGIAYLAFLQ